MTWLDRVIAWLSPAWAYRRAQFREALRQGQEAEAPRRQSHDTGWVRWDQSPLNPERVVAPPVAQDQRRRWTW